MAWISPDLPLIWLMVKKNTKWNRSAVTGDGGIAKHSNTSSNGKATLRATTLGKTPIKLTHPSSSNFIIGLMP
jgi:hypothetical protein